jgi:hypothetical protein
VVVVVVVVVGPTVAMACVMEYIEQKSCPCIQTSETP